MKSFHFIVFHNGKEINRRTIYAIDVNQAWMKIIAMYEDDCDFELVK